MYSQPVHRFFFLMILLNASLLLGKISLIPETTLTRSLTAGSSHHDENSETESTELAKLMTTNPYYSNLNDQAKDALVDFFRIANNFYIVLRDWLGLTDNNSLELKKIASNVDMSHFREDLIATQEALRDRKGEWLSVSRVAAVCLDFNRFSISDEDLDNSPYGDFFWLYERRSYFLHVARLRQAADRTRRETKAYFFGYSESIRREQACKVFRDFHEKLETEVSTLSQIENPTEEQSERLIENKYRTEALKQLFDYTEQFSRYLPEHIAQKAREERERTTLIESFVYELQMKVSNSVKFVYQNTWTLTTTAAVITLALYYPQINKQWKKRNKRLKTMKKICNK